MTYPVAILAGGLATRLGQVTKTIPKVMVEVAGKPFIEHQIELLKRNGVSHIVLCIGHLGETVQRHCGSGEAWNIRIDYSFDGPILLGTAGALKRARRLLGKVFFVMYGDSYLDVDFSTVQAAFQSSGRIGLMTVHRNEGQWDKSNVLYIDGKIIRYDKKKPSHDMLHIDYGLGVLRAETLDHLPDGQRHDLAEIYEDLVVNAQLTGFEVHQRFYEIGSPVGLEETRRYLNSVKQEGQ